MYYYAIEERYDDGNYEREVIAFRTPQARDAWVAKVQKEKHPITGAERHRSEMKAKELTPTERRNALNGDLIINKDGYEYHPRLKESR